MLRRRPFLTLAAGATLGPLARAAQFPSRTLKIVVPNAAGGAADITARAVAQKLALSLGQAVIVENKPSAGGIVAGEAVARSEPDGHTLLLVSSGTAVSAALFKSLPFDAVRDFAPVSLLATFDLVIAAREGPLVRESGGDLAGFNVSSWNGLAVPAKTPREVVQRLNTEVQAALLLPDVKQRLLELNLVAHGSTPVQLGEHLAADIRRWGDVIARARIPRQ